MERMFMIKTCQGMEAYVWVRGALMRLEDLHESGTSSEEVHESPGEPQRLQMMERLLESVLSL
jgi:hypothetical protein